MLLAINWAGRRSKPKADVTNSGRAGAGPWADIENSACWADSFPACDAKRLECSLVMDELDRTLDN